MAKIKCPHCGANNQDVTEQEKCWQCGTVLGAPAAATAEPLDTAPAAPAGADPVPGPTPLLQKAERPKAPSTTPSPAGRPVPLAAIVGSILLLLIVIIIVLMMMRR